MIKPIKLRRVDKKFLKKIGKNATNFLKILEKYEEYLKMSNMSNKEKDAMFIAVSMLPIYLIMDRMDDNMKRDMVMWILFQNKDILRMDMGKSIRDKLKERKFEKDYIG